jgi:kynurenine formamidase
MPRRIVDLTKPIAANGENGRFVVREFEHPDHGHSVHHRVELDTSVGTHVLTPRRLLRWGDALDEIPIETFFGEGLALRVGGDETVEVGSAELDEVAGSRLQQGDIVVLAAEGSAEPPARLTKLGAQWLFVRGAKLVVIDERIELGAGGDADGARDVLTSFFESGMPVVLGVTNTEQLSTDRFALMALPLQVADLAAWPVRVLALDPGSLPGAAPDADATERADTNGESEAITAPADQAGDPPAADDEAEPDQPVAESAAEPGAAPSEDQAADHDRTPAEPADQPERAADDDDREPDQLVAENKSDPDAAPSDDQATDDDRTSPRSPGTNLSEPPTSRSAGRAPGSLAVWNQESLADLNDVRLVDAIQARDLLE